MKVLRSCCVFCLNVSCRCRRIGVCGFINASVKRLLIAVFCIIAHIRVDERGDMLPGVSGFWALKPWTSMGVDQRVKFLSIFAEFMDAHECPLILVASVKNAATAVAEGKEEEALDMLVAAIGVRRARGPNKKVEGTGERSSAIVGAKKGLMLYEDIVSLDSTEDEVGFFWN